MIARREIITALGAAAFACPFAAYAQSDRIRRIGLLLSPAENDPGQNARNAAFFERLQALGWAEGRNLRIDVRWAGGDNALFHRYAEELVALAPDAIVVTSALGTQALRVRTPTIPIVFQFVTDPVEQGFVQSLAQPGGNITGLANSDFSMGGKWLQTLKDLAPGVGRVLIVNWGGAADGWMSPIEAAARALPLELSVARIVDISELENLLAAFAKSGGGGVVVPPSPFAAGHRDAYIRAMAAARLPTIYTNDAFPRAGGLASYGPDLLDLFRQGADMVDRILRGERPANIPVRIPAKYEFVVNLKTALALGITVAPSVLFRADTVIE